MINPNEITDYNRSETDLLEFAVFCVCVCGKNADQTARKVSQLFALSRFKFLMRPKTGLYNIEWYTQMDECLHQVKMGQYTRIIDALRGLRFLNLRECSVSRMLDIKGIGPKTANFFLLHSRRDYEGIVLDVHILRWLRSKGFDSVPASTPSGKAYEKWARLARECMYLEYPEMSVAEADLTIWKKGRA